MELMYHYTLNTKTLKTPSKMEKKKKKSFTSSYIFWTKQILTQALKPNDLQNNIHISWTLFVKGKS